MTLFSLRKDNADSDAGRKDVMRDTNWMSQYAIVKNNKNDDRSGCSGHDG